MRSSLISPTTMRLVVLSLVAPAIAFAQSPAKRGITPEDYFSFELASDPHVSPDGSQVVYVVSRVDRALNRRVPSIWIAGTGCPGSPQSAPSACVSAPRVLIEESWSPSAPRWLPDGRSISFISSRSPEDT